ncbi:hypothetical protein SHIRM173S_03837 [Streptomyces hirsutus]
MAGSRRAAVRRVPCGTVGVPSERGKNSYQEPYRARSRSTSRGIGSPAVTNSRRGYWASTASTSGVNAPASRDDAGRRSSRSASTAVRRAARRSGSGTWAAARSWRRAPSSSTSSVSMPAGILIRAWRRHVVTGSPHASTVYVQCPVSPAVTVAPQRSVPGASSRIGVNGPGRPSGSFRTTLAATASCPSRNTVAVTSNVSPTTAFAGRRPSRTIGRTSRTGIRPTEVAGAVSTGVALAVLAPAAGDRAGDGDGCPSLPLGRTGVVPEPRFADGRGPGFGDAPEPARFGGVEPGAGGVFTVSGVGGDDEGCLAGMTAPVRVNVGGRMTVGRWVLRGPAGSCVMLRDVPSCSAVFRGARRWS